MQSVSAGGVSVPIMGYVSNTSSLCTLFNVVLWLLFNIHGCNM